MLKTQKPQPGKKKNFLIENDKSITKQAKTLGPDQNAINLSTQELPHAEKSLLQKGPSFIPNPTDINQINLKRN